MEDLLQALVEGILSEGEGFLPSPALQGKHPDWNEVKTRVLTEMRETISGKMALDRLCVHHSTGEIFIHRHGRWVLTSRAALPHLYPGKAGDRAEALATRPVFESATFNPCRGPMIETKGRHINLFRRNPHTPVQPSKEEEAKLFDLVLALAGDDEEAAEYILDWMARPFQAFLAGNEDNILNMTALLFIGPEGSGKNTLFNLWSGVFMAEVDEGEQPPWLVLSTDNLRDDKTPDLHRCLAICGNEIRAENDINLANKLKTYITDSQIPLRRMKEAATSYRNWANWIFCSNHHFPLHIGESDRRFSVFKGKRIATHVLELSPQAVRGFWCSRFAYLLENRNIKHAVTKPFLTEWRQVLMEAGKSPAAIFAQKLKDEGLNSLWSEIPLHARSPILEDENARRVYDTVTSRWVEGVLPKGTVAGIFTAWAQAKGFQLKTNKDSAVRDVLVEAERIGIGMKVCERAPNRKSRYRHAVAGIPLDS